jgi:hypothetical protein
MRKKVELKSILSLLTIFIILIQQFGCVNSKITTTTELPSYYPKYAYKLYYKNSYYYLENIVFKKDTLSGKISKEDPEFAKYIVHLYLTSDSLVKINKAMMLSIPLSGIMKIKSTESAQGKSTLLVLGSIAVIAIIIFAATFSLEITL